MKPCSVGDAMAVSGEIIRDSRQKIQAEADMAAFQLNAIHSWRLT